MDAQGYPATASSTKNNDRSKAGTSGAAETGVEAGTPIKKGRIAKV
jgi:hypothetical protein